VDDICGNPSIEIMANNSTGGLPIMENHSSNSKMEHSNTSFGFEFDDPIKNIPKDILKQVSLLYLNHHSVRKNSNESQISLSIKGGSFGESSWFS